MFKIELNSAPSGHSTKANVCVHVGTSHRHSLSLDILDDEHLRRSQPLEGEILVLPVFVELAGTYETHTFHKYQRHHATKRKRDVFTLFLSRWCAHTLF